MNNEQLIEARKNKRTVALVGFAATTRDLTPWDDPNVEIWGLNKAHEHEWMKRADRWFQLHALSYLKKCRGQTESDRKHWDWLCEKHNFPIYCAEKYPEFPSSVRYPIEEARAKFGNFYTSTFAYQAAMAMLLGFERVEAYGFEMDAGTEYRYQRDSAEYFLGYMQDKGIEIYLPEKCPLLKGKLYAFDNVDIGLRQLYEFREAELKRQFDTEITNYNFLRGCRDKVMELVDKYEELKPKVDEYKDKVIKQGDLLQVINGSIHENKQSVIIFDEYYERGAEATR